MEKESKENFSSISVKESSKQKFKQLKDYKLKDFEFFDVLLKLFGEKNESN